MISKDMAVFGLYPSVVGSEQGAADLISAGFPCPDISVLHADLRSGPRPREQRQIRREGRRLAERRAGNFKRRERPSDCRRGPIVAAGPIAARLESLGCAATDSLSGALVDWGIPVFEAKSFEGRIQDGGTLLAVRCETSARAKRAKQVLNSSGADDVASLEESQAQKAGVGADLKQTLILTQTLIFTQALM